MDLEAQDCKNLNSGSIVIIKNEPWEVLKVDADLGIVTCSKIGSEKTRIEDFILARIESR